MDIPRAETDFAGSKPRLLFEQAGCVSTTAVRSYDMTRDGRRFLMAKREERKPRPATELLLVHNGFEDLEGPCPTKKINQIFRNAKEG